MIKKILNIIKSSEWRERLSIVLISGAKILYYDENNIPKIGYSEFSGQRCAVSSEAAYSNYSTPDINFLKIIANDKTSEKNLSPNSFKSNSPETLKGDLILLYSFHLFFEIITQMLIHPVVVFKILVFPILVPQKNLFLKISMLLPGKQNINRHFKTLLYSKLKNSEENDLLKKYKFLSFIGTRIKRKYKNERNSKESIKVGAISCCNYPIKIMQLFSSIKCHSKKLDVVAGYEVELAISL